MKEQFEVSAGTVLGRSHKLENKNNQDSFYYQVSKDFIVGVVCDGCGSGKNSEVGSKLGARIIVETLKSAILSKNKYSWPQLFEKSRLDIVAQLRLLANTMGESLSQVVVDYFLFTIVGFVITREETIVFSLGDGYISVNGSEEELGPFPKNEPPYISYAITGSSVTDKDPEGLQFRLNHILKTDEIDSLVIGTDGVSDLINSREKCLPGKDDSVGSVSQFWKEDKYFRNKDLLRRRLTLVNKDVVKYLRNQKGDIVEVKKENGLLPDDTTMIVVRAVREKSFWKNYLDMFADE